MGSITINPHEEGPKKSLNKDIKTQDKEIEITSNGITEVTPDVGFNYLNSVSVKTNVAQNGGGDSTSSVEYLDMRGQDGLETILPFSQYCIQEIAAGWTGVQPAAVPLMGFSSGVIKPESILAVAIDFSAPLSMAGGSLMTTKEYMLMANAITEENFNAIPRITKEEFYAL